MSQVLGSLDQFDQANRDCQIECVGGLFMVYLWMELRVDYHK
jgi:hypothetical protein